MKCKQKMRITEMMFNSVLEIYKEKGQMPLEEQYEHIVRDIFPKCNVQKLQYEDLLSAFRRKQKKFAQRIELHGVPDSKPTKVKKTDAEKLAKKRVARQHKKERQKQKALKEEMERYREYYDTFCFVDEYESDDELYDQTLEREEKLPF